VTNVTTKSARVRKQVGHPVIDADGHFVELAPVVDDEIVAYLEEAGGAELRERYLALATAPIDTATVLSDRNDPSVRKQWRAMPSWWGWQTNNILDRATCHLPGLLYERLDDMGIDFSILYASTTLSLLDLPDPELGGAVARAVNRWLARAFAPFRDRMTVAALVPMSRPDIAIAEATYAVRDLGLKAILIGGYARRPRGTGPSDGPRPYRLDTFGIDSEYDYDPFWQACADLGVAPVSHSAHQYHRVARSTTNYVYNHIGGLATSHESMAKSLFLGGVTRRFPSVKFGFLEGGVAWGCSLYADLIGHWEKRNGNAIINLDPDLLNVDELMQYVEKYGDDDVQSRLDRIRDTFARPAARPAQLDEFAACQITRGEDIRDLFVPSFYFGCEADDPMVAWAFNTKVNPFGANLRPLFGSDISHWDVPDMTEPVEEAYELVEHGLIDDDNFRDFTFLNAVRLHAAMNPSFFEGTVCEQAVAETIAGGLD
jgi:predicted TIM-barrel fold metal-dependent hydrolase